MSKDRSPSPDPPPFPLPPTLNIFVQGLKDKLVAQDRWESLEQAVKDAKNAKIKQIADWKTDSAEAFL